MGKRHSFRYALVIRKITQQINAISNNHDWMFYVIPQKNSIATKTGDLIGRETIMFLFIHF